MGINIKDVANKAGVSVSTVSRAFARPELVSKATRAKVLAIAEELNFLIPPARPWCSSPAARCAWLC